MIIIVVFCINHQRLFRVPSTESQAEIPFGRVNHNKYMVTDNAAYIGEFVTTSVVANKVGCGELRIKSFFPLL